MLSGQFVRIFSGHVGRIRLAITSVACDHGHCTLWPNGVEHARSSLHWWTGCFRQTDGPKEHVHARIGVAMDMTLSGGIAPYGFMGCIALWAAVLAGPLPPDGRVRKACPNSSS